MEKSGARILMVEDDKIFCDVMTIALDIHGFQTTTAADGIAAQQLITTQSFDLVLLDLRMPLFDGIRFVRWLRETAKMLMPVIVVTSERLPETLARAREAGATELVSKPVDIERLLLLIQDLTSPSENNEIGS